MAKVVGPDDIEKMQHASEKRRRAEEATTKARQQYVDGSGSLDAWEKALKAELAANDAYCKVHKEYFVEL